MFKNKISIVLQLFVSITFAFKLNSQTIIRCETNEFETFSILENPSLQMFKDAHEMAIQNYMQSGDAISRSTTQNIITIPVVFHLIGNTIIASALTKVQDQIDILNNDYGKSPGTNGDGNGVDTKIRFCLATTDPAGAPSNGIVTIPGVFPSTWNKSAPSTDPNSDLTLKSLSHWPAGDYLNIYVVEGITNSSGSTVLGYSTFPWYLTASENVDGVVIANNFFGNSGTSGYDLGRTTTHEVGHWLGLYHTFQLGANGTETPCKNDAPNSNGDLVFDTPPVYNIANNGPNYTCTTANSCHTESPDVNDLIENYLDYTPDACMNMFTQGQANRMIATLNTTRYYALFTSCIPSCANGVQDPGEEGIDCGGGTCPPCVVDPTGGLIGSSADFLGCGNSNQSNGWDQIVFTNCHTVQFTINGKSTNDIINTCPSDIILSPYNYATQQGLGTRWLFDITQSDKLCSHTSNMWQAASKNYDGLFNNHCDCYWAKLFIAIQECDQNLNLIGSEYSEYKYFFDGNQGNFSEINSIYSFNINDYLPAGFQFQGGKYYKIKIASFMHGSSLWPWVEHSGWVRIYEDDLLIQNQTITRNQFANNITIENSTVPITANIKVDAKTQIKISPNSFLKNGRYYIESFDCTSLSQFRTADTTTNTPQNPIASSNNSGSGNRIQNNNSLKIESEKTSNNTIKVYPNPANEIVNIEFTINTQSDKNVSINLYDLKNNLVRKLIDNKKFPYGTYNHNLNCSDVQDGVYFIKCLIDNESIIKKIVIIK
jgi:hypothetical protein